MNKILREKIQEALSSVLPITLIVLVLSMTITPMPVGTLVLFLAGAVLLIVGMAFFSLGTDVSMTPMGEGIGAQLPKTKNLAVVIAITLLIGILITIAEPDLQVLAGQVPSIPNSMLIWTVAVGVGLFFVLALLRTIFKIRLSLLLILFYIAVFSFSAFVPNEFVSVAFDSGGVTTGPITVPFIMALGVGLASIRGDSDAQDDSFGLVALCSIGPVLAVLLLGIFYSGGDAGYTQIAVPELEDTRQIAAEFIHALPDYIREVVSALLPVIAFCAIFQLIFKRFHKIQLQKIGIGFLYTFVGLALFLTGVNVGFMPAGHYLGQQLALSGKSWILIPLGMLIGYFLVTAEPAVHVLNRQVETITNGGISQRAMMLSLSIGVACSVGLAMLRVLTGISIYYILIPGYLIALALTFFVPKIFTGIAFDSGGVASGPMTTTFLLPFSMGACEALGGNVLTDAFGIVAMVAMTPLLTIQMLGLLYRFKQKDMPQETLAADDEDSIIVLGGILDMMEHTPQMTAQSGLAFAVAVVDVGKGEKILSLFREEHALLDYVCMAHGTARTEMLDLLGIGETAKAVVFCLAASGQAQRILNRLGKELQMRYPGRGIAFTIPVSGIGRRWHSLLTQADEQEEIRMNKSEQTGFDVVAVVMERGYTNVAMDAARKAGARGGTVISARGIAENEVKRFFGIEIQAEKEIVFLVVKSAEKQQVMTELMRAVGTRTRSHGLILSMPVSDAIGLAD